MTFDVTAKSFNDRYLVFRFYDGMLSDSKQLRSKLVKTWGGGGIDHTFHFGGWIQLSNDQKVKVRFIF